MLFIRMNIYFKTELKVADDKNKPITKAKEVEQSNDPRIDQDVPGFPHHHAEPKKIKESAPKDKPSGEDC